MTDQLDQLDQLEADLASVEEAMESLARIAADGGDGALVVAQIEAVVSAERFADVPGDTAHIDDATGEPAIDHELVDDDVADGPVHDVGGGADDSIDDDTDADPSEESGPPEQSFDPPRPFG